MAIFWMRSHTFLLALHPGQNYIMCDELAIDSSVEPLENSMYRFGKFLIQQQKM